MPSPQEELESDIEGGFEPFIPKLVQTSRFCVEDTCKVPCEGCGLEFFAKQQKNRKNKLIYSVEYYRHCLLECIQYRTLGLHTKCWNCKKVFMRQSNYDYHLRSYPSCQSYHTKLDQVVKKEKVNSSDEDSGTEIDDEIVDSSITSTSATLSSEVSPFLDGDHGSLDEPLGTSCSQLWCRDFKYVGHISLDFIRRLMTPEVIKHVVRCPHYLKAKSIPISCLKCRVSFPDYQSYIFHKTQVCPFLS